MDSEDLDAGEVAAILGLAHRNSVSTYRTRYPDFPPGRPAPGGGRSRLWDRDEIVNWHRAFRARQAEDSEEPSERLEALVAATARLLLANPGEDVSIRQIAAEAGVAHSDLYRYADSKEQLVDRAIARVEASIRTAIPDSYDDFVERLPEILVETRRARSSILVLTDHALKGDSPAPRTSVAVQAIADLLRSRSTDDDSGIDPRLKAAAIAGMVWGLIALEDRWITALELDEIPNDEVVTMIRALLNA